VTQAQLVADLTDDVVMIAFAASVLFIAAYTVLASWWTSPIGRALVMLDAGLALVLGPLVLHRLAGLTLVSSIGYAWYDLVSLALVAGATLWRTVIVVRVQLQARKPQREPDSAET
jgi:MFS family permease